MPVQFEEAQRVWTNKAQYADGERAFHSKVTFLSYFDAYHEKPSQLIATQFFHFSAHVTMSLNQCSPLRLFVIILVWDKSMSFYCFIWIGRAKKHGNLVTL